MRLLRCQTCHTIEQLPDPPRGVNPNNIHEGEDPLLDELVSRHQTNGQPHIGDLHHVEADQWNHVDADKRANIRREIMERLGHTGETGLGKEAYAFRDTYHEDALKCFAEHNRPERCIDWHIDRKKLGRPTKEGQAFQREYFNAPAVFLCDFCPVASKVMQAKTEAAGGYS